MDYTEKQYALLEKLNRGICLDTLSESELSVLHFLDERKLVQPREDIRDGWLTLSEAGQLALLRRDTEIRDKQEQEQRRRSEKADAAAARRAERRANYVTQIFVALLSALLSNLDRIVPLVVRLFRYLRSLLPS